MNLRTIEVGQAEWWWTMEFTHDGQNLGDLYYGAHPRVQPHHLSGSRLTIHNLPCVVACKAQNRTGVISGMLSQATVDDLKSMYVIYLRTAYQEKCLLADFRLVTLGISTTFYSLFLSVRLIQSISSSHLPLTMPIIILLGQQFSCMTIASHFLPRWRRVGVLGSLIGVQDYSI